jgi:membrane-anchored mycosin MYCP
VDAGVRWAAAALVAGLAVVGPVPTAAPGLRAGCAAAHDVYAEGVPWPQRLLDPARIWPLTNGTGVTVAVLGTGVDATNPQFGAGQVGAVLDVTGSAPPSTPDCDGRGTFAAGIIAAYDDRTTTFAGMAPGVRVLPVRYTQGAQPVDPDRLAAAIRAATRPDVQVICVVAPALVDNPALRDAVARAYAAGAVVVSPAIGQPATGTGRSYPTTDDRVLAVAGIADDGSAVSTETGDHIDVAAPGKGLVSLAATVSRKPGHLWWVDDAAYAAAFVAGTVALVRAYRPALTPAQVVDRIRRTASGTPNGGHDPGLGWGVVNPYAAVTAEGIDGPSPVAANVVPTVVAAARPPAPPARERSVAAAAVGGLLLAFLVAVGAVVVRRGRARRWRPGR